MYDDSPERGAVGEKGFISHDILRDADSPELQEEELGLHRGLKSRHITMIAIGKE